MPLIQPAYGSGDSSLVPFCKALTSSAIFIVLEGQSEQDVVEFQFPPKIVSDSNSSDWLEVDIWSFETMKIHKGSSGRKVNMEWEYIATDRVFNAKKIQGEIHKLKSYFFEFNGTDYPIVRINYTEILREVPMRLRDLSVSHGPEIINNNGLYPLYTKVAVTMDLATPLSKSGDSDKPKNALAPMITSEHW
jgi:hypothetical protein